MKKIKYSFNLVAGFLICFLFFGTAMAQQSVTIIVKPKPTGDIANVNTTVCTGKLYQYAATTQANSLDADTVELVSWSVVPVLTSTASGVVQSSPVATKNEADIIFSNSSATAAADVYVILKFRNSISLCENSDTLTVNVAPNATLAFTGSPTQVCSEKEATFTTTTSNATITAWSVNAGSTGVTYTIDQTTMGSPKITFVNTTNTVEQVYVKAAYQNTIAPTCTYEDSITVLVFPTPNADIIDISGSAPKILVCSDTTVVAQYSLSAPTISTPATPPTIVSTAWSLHTLPAGVTATIDASTGALRVTENTNPTDQIVRVIATYAINNGICDGATYTDTLDVTVHPTPNAVLGTNGPKSTCNNSEISLKATFTRGAAAPSWSFEWKSNPALNQSGSESGITGTSRDFTATPSTTAAMVTYGIVKVTDGNGCVNLYPQPIDL